MTSMAPNTSETVGVLVKRWREHRRRSQLDVSLAAEMSTRHLSYIETGRSNPSREMIERLCEELEVPLRERNRFHLAAGFAPVHTERPFADLGAARAAVESVLGGLEPNPAVAVNVCWDLLAANRAMIPFVDDLPTEATEPRLNMLRATLHPDGLAGQIRNFDEWRSHVLRRVRRQLDRTAAVGLAELLAELESYPTSNGMAQDDQAADSDLVVPLQLRTENGELSLLYAVTVFGSPRDVTLDEIAIEAFFPADDATAALLTSLSGAES